MLNNLLVVAVTAVLLGAPLALLGSHFRASIRLFNRRAVPAVGAVVGHRAFLATGGSWDRHMTEALVLITRRDGRVIEKKGIVRPLSQPPQPPVGSTVSLLHDPVSDEVSFDGPRGRAKIADLLFWMGLVLCACGLLAAGAGLLLTFGV